MKDEIKEIFDIKELFDEWKRFLRWCYENNDKTVEIHRDKLKWVMDYITNLKEKNERLKEQKEHLLIDLDGESEYKVMCQKAIEYIEKDILDNKIENVDWDYDECYWSDMPAERIKPLIDILQGKDEELKENK